MVIAGSSSTTSTTGRRSRAGGGDEAAPAVGWLRLEVMRDEASLARVSLERSGGRC
jgi:hypothetical protein